MPHIPRIGIQIGPGDPFWVQVQDVIWQRAQALPVELVEIAIQQSELFSEDEQAEVVEGFVVQAIDALICNTYPISLITRILNRGIPIIRVSESIIRHPYLTSHVGLYDAAFMLGTFIIDHLPNHSTLLVVGGAPDDDDDGTSRLNGFHAALLPEAHYQTHYTPSQWSYEGAYQSVTTYLSQHPQLHIDAIFGLSDPIALAARDACRALGRIDSSTLVLGINGDLLALAAITDGTMTATVEADVDDIATQAVDLAYQATRGETLPPHFQNRQRLITADTVADVALRKLKSLASLPTRLVGVNRRNEQQRVVQLETSLAIDQQVGQILDQHALALAITGLIRDNYGFDHARFVHWNAETATLVEMSNVPRADGEHDISIDLAGPLAYALTHNRTVFVADLAASHRFAPDPVWPAMRARVVVPVHLGGQIVGLLDLHHHRATHHTREQLDGLQLLADQLGISMRNAELYGQALAARATAEQADQLKTHLLANVSHELRTPLNIILGYSHTAIAALDADRAPADELRHDLMQIYRSGEHLLRLINDLLDLSRAEIDELDLLLETVDTRAFLKDVFQSSAEHFGASAAVTWRLELPPQLPAIEADSVRLRQILLNLLHNAHKFTQRGQITLGAEVVSPHLHIWVADTGPGIPSAQQAQIFEPFVSVDVGVRRREGIGLGLSITRRLVVLHHGWMQVDSSPSSGSIFHVYLPLPVLRELPASADTADRPVLLLIADGNEPPAELVQLAARRDLALHHLRSNQDLADLLATTRPALVSWSLEDDASAGWSLVQQIRAHPQLSQLPLILYQREPNTATADATGVATGLLLKPLSDGTLIETLDHLDPREPSGSILIVEDDPQIRALHRRIIAQHFPTYSIWEADSGRGALDVLARETPTLVVLDLVMPEVDGFAVLAALRANPRTVTVPVLVLSGRTLSADDIQRLSAARVVFQTKNILTRDELAESLRRSLTRDDALPPHTSALVKQAISVIQQRHSDTLTRQEIADAVGVSKDYLGRIFHQELDLSPWEYLIRYRVLRAKELLRTTSYSIAEVAARVGFDTATYFSHIFHREVGCSPRAFRAARGDSTDASLEG